MFLNLSSSLFISLTIIIHSVIVIFSALSRKHLNHKRSRNVLVLKWYVMDIVKSVVLRPLKWEVPRCMMQEHALPTDFSMKNKWYTSSLKLTKCGWKEVKKWSNWCFVSVAQTTVSPWTLMDTGNQGWDQVPRTTNEEFASYLIHLTPNLTV